MLFIIGLMYAHPLCVLLSRYYRENWRCEINYANTIIAAFFAVFNIMIVLKGSPICSFYGFGVGLSIIATSYLITQRK
jgi:hypothetical protein